MTARLAILGGAGTIGKAIVAGILERKLLAPEEIVVTARHRASLERVKALGVQTTLDNKAAISQSETVVLAVHPGEALELLRTHAESFQQDKLLISVVTGVSLRELGEATGSRAKVIRAMPNIAAIVGASATTLCVGPEVAPNQVDWARQIFEAVGTTLMLDEVHLDACTGLAGCGPAFAFKVIESLSSGGVKMGLPRDVSRLMAAWVLLGAAKLVLGSGKHPAELKDDVCTPGGCTIDGIAELEARGLPIAMIAAVEASTRKAAVLKARREKCCE